VIRSRGPLVLALALLVASVLLGVVAVLRGRMPLPVVAHLGGGTIQLAAVDLAAAVLVPPVLAAIVAAVRSTGRLERTAAVWAAGAAAPIVLFLVARVNGLAEAMALVLVYACAAGGVLLRSLHRSGGDPKPLRWWAVLGIVPWGVVAFTQIGAGATGAPPDASVRVLTLVVLAASIAEFVVVHRGRDAPSRPTLELLLAALPGVLLALLVLATVP
jgi:heme A synthase